MREKRYTVYLKGGGPKIEPDENPREAQIADEMMKELECPLSQNFMLDPVFVSSGKTFDRRLISLEIIRQRSLNPVAILLTPVTSVPMTDVLTPNLQMRSITAKFVEKYKDVKYRGPIWDNVRLSCEMYEEEQTPERLEERKLEDEKIEETKRLFELRKHQAQERILRENERIIQEQQRVIQGQMLELNRLREREQERERLARQARERLESEKRERLAREARETRNAEISKRETVTTNTKIVSRPVESERERLAREERERLAREARRQRLEREAEIAREAEVKRIAIAKGEAELRAEKERLAREAAIAREAEKKAERERLAIEERYLRLAKEAERNREREAAQIAAQEETARLEQIAQGNFYRERDPPRRRRRP